MSRTAPLSLRPRLGAWVERPSVQNLIITLICLNAVTLGLATFDTVTRQIGGALALFEAAVLTVFVAEIGLKLIAYDWRFFRDGWNVFDFLVVGVSVVPGSGPFAVLRALRILRVLRLLVKVERLRMIVESLLRAVPGIGWIAFLLLLVFYVFGVIGTELFGERFPDDFGHLGLALYSLFQVMTLESWSEEIARPIMEVYPLAWAYFVAFIVVSAFTVLNLFIGIIVSTMQEYHYDAEQAQRDEVEARAHGERTRMLELVEALHDRMDRLERRLDGSTDRPGGST